MTSQYLKKRADQKTNFRKIYNIPENDKLLMFVTLIPSKARLSFKNAQRAAKGYHLVLAGPKSSGGAYSRRDNAYFDSLTTLIKDGGLEKKSNANN